LEIDQVFNLELRICCCVYVLISPSLSGGALSVGLLMVVHKTNSTYVAHGFVLVTRCVLSSLSGDYTDLRLGESIFLAMLRDNYETATQILAKPMVTWEFSTCLPLSNTFEFESSDHAFLSNMITSPDRLSGALHGLFSECSLLSPALLVKEYIPDRFGTIHLLKTFCERIFRSTLPFFCTPHTYPDSLSIAPGKRRPIVADISAAPGDDDIVSDDEECGENDVTEKLTSYPLSTLLRSIQLMVFLKHSENLPRVVKLASAFVVPVDEHIAFVAGCDSGRVRFPSRYTLHRAAVKLDYLSILYQRRLWSHALHNDVVWSSQFGGDSSPQSTFDFMNMIEHRMIFRGSPEVIAACVHDHGINGCFTHVRRTLGAQVVGLANSGTAQKFGLFAKALVMETELVDVPSRRLSVDGWLADQGVDLGVGDCPNAEHGDLGDLIRKLSAGEIDFASVDARNGYFLPNAITIPDLLHILFGALRESLESSEAWPFLSQLYGSSLSRSAAKCGGTASSANACANRKAGSAD
jgi:hypothetical protein